MTCPVCKRASAPNATHGDRRCGPCHNFGVERIDGYAILLRLDFEKWLRDTKAEIVAANNLNTYAEWLEALHAAYRREGKDND